MFESQGRIQDLVFGGTKFGKVIWDACWLKSTHMHVIQSKFNPKHFSNRGARARRAGPRSAFEYHMFMERTCIVYRKIKIDLQFIMIIWGEETEPLFSLSLFSFFSIYFLCLFGIFCFFTGGGVNVPFAPLWIRQWKL